MVDTPPSCETGEGGTGPRCGTRNVTCCESRPVPGGMYYRRLDNPASTKNVHLTAVSNFLLDTYEISVGRFRTFLSAGQGTQESPPEAKAGAHPQIWDSGWRPAWNESLVANREAFDAALLGCDGREFMTWTEEVGDKEKLPMNCITWFEAFAFCVWDGGRLPTEAEWYYAATGGKEQRYYPWSSPSHSTDIDPSHAVHDCTVDGLAPEGCVSAGPRQVGSRSPNGDGLWGQSDLAGNVWEWTLDWFANGYIPPDPEVCHDCANTDDTANTMSRVVRGGSFNNKPLDLRAAKRLNIRPVVRNTFIGARCARNPPAR